MEFSLNIEIINEKKHIANAFFLVAGTTTQEMIPLLVKINTRLKELDEPDPYWAAVQLLLSTGAAFPQEEIDRIVDQLHPVAIRFLPRTEDLEQGVIASTLEGIRETQAAENRKVSFYLDERVIVFDCFDEYSRSSIYDSGYSMDEVTETSMDPDCLPFDDLEEFLSFLQEMIAEEDGLFCVPGVYNDTIFQPVR